MSLLGQHWATHCFYELFHNKFEQRTLFFDQRYRDGEDGGEFAKQVFSRRYPALVKAVGFKLFYSQALTEPASRVWEYLASDPSIKIIELHRRNRFETFVSFQVALQSKQWVKRRFRLHRRKIVTPPFEVQAKEFKEWLEREDELRRIALQRLHNNQRLTIAYEDLCQDRTKTVADVYQFLGIRSYPRAWLLRDTLSKQQTTPLTEQVANYLTLKAEFQDTELAHCFLE